MSKISVIFLSLLFLTLGCNKVTDPVSEKPKQQIPPVIQSINVVQYANDENVIYRGDKDIEFECVSYDKDGFIADYVWDATGGTIHSSANHARWDAPLGAPGKYYITCTVKDNDNNIARQRYEVTTKNRSPYIKSIAIFQTEPVQNPEIKTGDTAHFIISWTDPEHDPVQFRFIYPDTTTPWLDDNQSVWGPKVGMTGSVMVYCEVKDIYDGIGTDSVKVTIIDQ